MKAQKKLYADRKALLLWHLLLLYLAGYKKYAQYHVPRSAEPQRTLTFRIETQKQFLLSSLFPNRYKWVDNKLVRVRVRFRVRFRMLKKAGESRARTDICFDPPSMVSEAMYSLLGILRVWKYTWHRHPKNQPLEPCYAVHRWRLRQYPNPVYFKLPSKIDVERMIDANPELAKRWEKDYKCPVTICVWK